jgi:hypothetical protein
LKTDRFNISNDEELQSILRYFCLNGTIKQLQKFLADYFQLDSQTINTKTVLFPCISDQKLEQIEVLLSFKTNHGCHLQLNDVDLTNSSEINSLKELALNEFLQLFYLINSNSSNLV